MSIGPGISPEFLELIQRAARETISIPVESHAMAIKFRQRLHSARKYLMRAASKPGAQPSDVIWAELAESIETSIVNNNGAYMLVVRPRNSQFREALLAVGIGVKPASEPPANEPEAKPEAKPADPMLAYLNRKE